MCDFYAVLDLANMSIMHLVEVRSNKDWKDRSFSARCGMMQAVCLCPGYVRVRSHALGAPHTTHIIRFFTLERLSEYIRCQKREFSKGFNELRNKKYLCPPIQVAGKVELCETSKLAR